jgi:hypothetical protein
MWCVIVKAEAPFAIGPFRSKQRAEWVADRWNAKHDREGEYAVAEPMYTFEQAEDEL